MPNYEENRYLVEHWNGERWEEWARYYDKRDQLRFYEWLLHNGYGDLDLETVVVKVVRA